MTQDDFNRKVELVLEARKIIKELRDAGLIKDSYNVIFNAGFNGIERQLRSTKAESK